VFYHLPKSVGADTERPVCIRLEKPPGRPEDADYVGEIIVTDVSPWMFKNWTATLQWWHMALGYHA